MANKELFSLIDKSYNEDLSTQPYKYKETLLESAKMLLDGAKEMDVCVKIYRSYHNNYMVPMTFPKENRLLYQYIYDRLKKLDQKRLRELNIGYGLIATHYTFGSNS